MICSVPGCGAERPVMITKVSVVNGREVEWIICSTCEIKRLAENRPDAVIAPKVTKRKK